MAILGGQGQQVDYYSLNPWAKVLLKQELGSHIPPASALIIRDLWRERQMPPWVAQVLDLEAWFLIAAEQAND